MYIMRQTQRSAPVLKLCSPAVMLLCLPRPVTGLLKGLPRPRNYSEVKGQRGRVYLAPHGERVLDWHSHHWKSVKEPKPPDPRLVNWQWKTICIQICWLRPARLSWQGRSAGGRQLASDWLASGIMAYGFQSTTFLPQLLLSLNCLTSEVVCVCVCVLSLQMLSLQPEIIFNVSSFSDQIILFW